MVKEKIKEKELYSAQNRTSIGESIKTQRELRNISQGELGAIFGRTAKAVSSWEAGRTEPPREIIAKMCEMWNLDFQEFLFGKTDNSHITVTLPANAALMMIPVYDAFAPKQLDDPNFISDYMSLPTFMFSSLRTEYFAVCVTDNSMNGLGFVKDDLVVFAKDKEPKIGDIGIFDVKGTAYIRQVAEQDGTLYLVSANPFFAPIKYTKDVRALGLKKYRVSTQ